MQQKNGKLHDDDDDRRSGLVFTPFHELNKNVNQPGARTVESSLPWAFALDCPRNRQK